jgi:hypothetical protein
MNVKESYKYWLANYDTNENGTRDLEAISLDKIIATKTLLIV